MNRFLALVGGFGVLLWLGANDLAAQRFELSVLADRGLKSTAQLKGNRLVINTNSRSFVYDRQPAFDSEDGQFAAYYSHEAKQYVRFPVSGKGKMFIGSGRGLTVTWRQSEMVVRELGTPASSPPSQVTGSAASTTMQPAYFSTKSGVTYLASVDVKGKLLLFKEEKEGWQSLPLKLNHQFVSHSATVLVASSSGGIPDVITIDAQGRLAHIVNGRLIKILSKDQSPNLVPGSRIAVNNSDSYLVVADRKGRIWAYDLKSNSFNNIENRTGLIATGSDLALLGDELFVIDRLGNLVGYSQTGSTWSKPHLVATGFQSGGKLSGWQSPGANPKFRAFASVNKKGRPQLFVWDQGAWRQEAISDIVLAPGSPIAVSSRGGTTIVSTVDRNGRWLSFRKIGGSLVSTWTPTTISRGYAVGGNVVLGPRGNLAFSIDRSGQLVAASYRNNSWNCFLCNPLSRFAPRLRQREIIPNPAIPPAEIILKNNHQESIVVRIFDKRDKSKKYDLTLPPNTSKKIKVDRDSGAVARESISVVGPLGGVQESRVVDLPPQLLYDVVVLEKKVTSQFFDRTKNKTNRPDSEQKSLVSIGVFAIPPGPQIKNGSQLAVFNLAKSQQNPGAAAHFGPINQ